MSSPITLASGSKIRAQLLQNAGVRFQVRPAVIDELSVMQTHQRRGATAQDIATTLARLKAVSVAEQDQGALVIGCDQVLALGQRIFMKPTSPDEAIAHLRDLRGQTHQLLSAVSIVEGDQPVWSHVGVAELTMRDISDGYLADYVMRNRSSIQDAVGCYKLEEEGVRLFTRIQGDYFTVLGLPLLEVLSYLTSRGTLPS
ncbi:MAG: Maf family nucleotide pyrophosphatase [Pseudomonadota bacterium]